LVSLLLLLALLVMFYVFPYDAAGRRLTDVDILTAFGHPALVAICCLMILGRGLTMTGALEPAVRVLRRVWRWNFWLGLLLTLLLALAASAFINDTPVLVLMLPMLLRLAEQTGHPVTRTLMPVNCAILVGGMLTSVGTSTNLLVLSIATDLGMAPMGIFGFTPIALAALVVAVPYLWLIAPLLLPRGPVRPAEAERRYTARLVVEAHGGISGRTLAQLGRKLGHPLPVKAVLRGSDRLTPEASLRVQTGDTLVLEDTAGGLRDIAAVFAVDLFAPQGNGRPFQEDTGTEDVELAEFVIGGDSPLIDRTLAGEGFAEKHGVAIVGISRGSDDLLRAGMRLDDIRLAPGDLILAQGPRERVRALRSQPGLLMLDSNLSLPRSPRARIAIAIMASVIAIAAFKVLPIHVAAFIGVVAMLVSGCLSLENIGKALSLEVVLIVASSIALGQSLVATGAAEWIAGGLSKLVTPLPPAWQLAVFMAAAALLTNFVSNSAAAAVGTPIAIATATRLGLPLEPFALAILFGANLAFATPMAYQTNLLIMNAARYRFADFVRVGLPLVLLMLATLSFLLARAYNLEAVAR
ncbi:MAG: SLC13 family permease, partial [Steroidobacteraceae bacterium]|nr:SLC13 family permease [Steroidobacteraceae bacterium]